MSKKFNKTETAMMEVARAYGWGTPQSRAIVTAVEHSRIVTGRAPPRQ